MKQDSYWWGERKPEYRSRWSFGFQEEQGLARKVQEWNPPWVQKSQFVAPAFPEGCGGTPLTVFHMAKVMQSAQLPQFSHHNQNVYRILMHFASSDFSPITCYMNSCDLLSPNLGWEEWMASTLHSRRFHSSSVTNQGILLIGGDDSPETSELLPWGTNQSIPSISLPPPGRSRHCTIQISQDVIILTGGNLPQTSKLVTEISNLGSNWQVGDNQLKEGFCKTIFRPFPHHTVWPMGPLFPWSAVKDRKVCTFILGSNQRATSIDHWQMGTWMWDVQECGWGHQVTSSSFVLHKELLFFSHNALVKTCDKTKDHFVPFGKSCPPQIYPHLTHSKISCGCWVWRRLCASKYWGNLHPIELVIPPIWSLFLSWSSRPR